MNATLVVAGTFFEPVERFRAQAKGLGLRLDTRYILLPGYVPRDQAPALFALADVVALPYRSASQSGVIAQAALAGQAGRRDCGGGSARGGRRSRCGRTRHEDPAALAAGIVRALESPPPPPSLPDGGWDDWRDILLASPRRRRRCARPSRGSDSSAWPRAAPRAVSGADRRRHASRGATAAPRTASTHDRRSLSSRRRRTRDRLCGRCAGVSVDQAGARGPSLARRCRTVEAPPVEPPVAAAPQPPARPEAGAPPPAEPELLGWRRWPLVVLRARAGRLDRCPRCSPMRPTGPACTTTPPHTCCMGAACSTRSRPASASSGTTGLRSSTSWSCRSCGSIRCTTACGRAACLPWPST